MREIRHRNTKYIGIGFQLNALKSVLTMYPTEVYPEPYCSQITSLCDKLIRIRAMFDKTRHYVCQKEGIFNITQSDLGDTPQQRLLHYKFARRPEREDDYEPIEPSDFSTGDLIFFDGIIKESGDLLGISSSSKDNRSVCDILFKYLIKIVRKHAHADRSNLIIGDVDAPFYWHGLSAGDPPFNFSNTPVQTLSVTERFNHTYVIGKTSSGKSTLLKNLIAQDIEDDHTTIVIASEDDLFRAILPYVSEERGR